ncbi:MAG: ABC transporter substrate-binding protein [Actinomycetota bacterium]
MKHETCDICGPRTLARVRNAFGTGLLTFALVVLMGCGGGSSAGDDEFTAVGDRSAPEVEASVVEPSPGPTQPPVGTSTPAPTVAESVVDGESDGEVEDRSATSTDASEESTPATRVITTPVGDFEIPTDPERIVITDTAIGLPTAFDLGVPVYGTWDISGRGTPDGTVLTDEEWVTLEIVGSGTTPNIETLAASAPDLIIHRPILDGDLELLGEVAPVLPVVPTLDWQQDAQLLANALGRGEELADLVADYDARAEALSARIDDELGDPSIAVLRIRPDSMRVHTNLHFSGELLDAVGLRVPDAFTAQPATDRLDSTLLVRLSLEQIGMLADADYIWILPVGTAVQSQEDVDAAVAEVQANALWQTLPAVQAGRVDVLGSYWFVGSLRAATWSLDDIERMLFGGS